MTPQKEIINIYGGQLNLAKDYATIHVIQNNSMDTEKINTLIDDIMNNLSKTSKENTEIIIDALDMIKEEIGKQKPKTSRFRNCVTLLAPLVTITNGIPELCQKLQVLIDYISSYI